MLERNGRQGATAFASEAELRQHWDAAGLADVETTSLLARVLYPSFDDLWQSLLSGSTPVSAAVAALPSSARAEVHDQLLAQLAGGSDSGSFELESKAFAVRGRAVRQTHRARGAEARSR